MTSSFNSRLYLLAFLGLKWELVRLFKIGPGSFWVGDFICIGFESVLSRLMTWFGNESISDFKHLAMTQQFYTQIQVFHGAVVLYLITQSFPNLGERNPWPIQVETTSKF